MSTQHNESLADHIVDAKVNEGMFVKDNGSKPYGLEASLVIPAKYIYGATALIAGVVLGRKLGFIGGRLSDAKHVVETGVEAAKEEATS